MQYGIDFLLFYVSVYKPFVEFCTPKMHLDKRSMLHGIRVI